VILLLLTFEGSFLGAGIIGFYLIILILFTLLILDEFHQLNRFLR
jgi:hypothetical protein